MENEADILNLSLNEVVLTRDVKAVVTYCRAKFEGFPDLISEDTKNKILEAYKTKYKRKVSKPKIVYTEDGDLTINVDLVFSYTQQAFGGLKNTKPLLHAQLKILRDNTSDYCSGRYRDLLKEAKNGGNNQKKSVPNINFNTYLNETLEEVVKRSNIGISRGDQTCNKERLQRALETFYFEWNCNNAEG